MCASTCCIHEIPLFVQKNNLKNPEFKEIGDEYLEDGIPHINMIKS